MMRRWLGPVAGLLIIPGLALSANAAEPANVSSSGPATGPREGQIIPASGPGGGWNERIGSYYEELSPDAPSDPKDPVRVIRSRCCVGVYEKGTALMVLKTAIAARSANGNPQSLHVERVLTLTKRPGEALASCSIVWLSPVVSLFNAKTGLVRSVVIDNGQLTVFTFVDNGRNCAIGGD